MGCGCHAPGQVPFGECFPHVVEVVIASKPAESEHAGDQEHAVGGVHGALKTLTPGPPACQELPAGTSHSHGSGGRGRLRSAQMHEFSIVTALLEQVDEQARRHKAQAVRGVRVRIGELSGVEPELVKSAFEIVRVGTLCAAADIDIVPVPAVWACAACDRPIEGGGFCCPECGQTARLVAGDDLILETIQLEVA